MNRNYNHHHQGQGQHTYPPPASVWPSRSWQPAARNTNSNPLQESAEQAAASALLIAAGGPRKDEVDRLQQQRITTNVKQEDKSRSSSTVKVESQPALVCHVSPHSTEGEPSSSSTQIISDFPAKLHRVLTKSDFAGTVLEWLPTGTSWRVLRWNELSTAVIPTHFPELLSEDTTGSNGKDGGSGGSGSSEEEVTSDRMNRFLYQIKAHGFEEIRNVGPDMGAYRHEVSLFEWF